MKGKIKNALSLEELTLFVFTPEELENLDWEDSKEFRSGGNLYDVVRKIVADNGKIKVYCVDDKKEKEIFAHLDDYNKSNASNSKDSKRPLALKLFSTAIGQVYVSVIEYVELNSFHKVDIQILVSFIQKIPSPPPKEFFKV